MTRSVDPLVARLSRAVQGLLAYWHKAGVVDAHVTLWLTRIEKAWHAMANQCRCDPPGSGEEWCTGHCKRNATT